MASNQSTNILFRPDNFHVRDIQEIAKRNNAGKQEMATIFGKEMLDQILNSQPILSIPAGGMYQSFKESNLVVLWGLPNSGRTSAIFSMLVQKNFRVCMPQEKSLQDRINLFLNIFKKQTVPTIVPSDLDSHSTEIYNASYKKHLFGKKYNISYVKPISYALGVDEIDLLNKNKEQIHIFCVDCTQKNALQKQKQLDYFYRVLAFLDKNNFLSVANGIYVLVTKSDRMFVPMAYRDNAAQTFVTSTMKEFWQKILNICYQKQIYNAQPIVYSVGSYILKDFAILNSQSAQELTEEFIIPKCQPNRNLLEKFLGIGKIWQTVIIVCALAGAALYGLHKFYDSIVPPPTKKIMPIDYVKYFWKEEQSSLPGSDFDESISVFNRLQSDLNVESSIILTNHEKLMSFSQDSICRSKLLNDYADIINSKCKELFESDNWTQDQSFLKKLSVQIADIIKEENKPYLKSLSISQYNEYISDYFNMVKPLLVNCKNCMSRYDIETCVAEANNWSKPPYSTDTKLEEELKDVPYQAYKSCSSWFVLQASEKIRQFLREKSNIEKNSNILTRPFRIRQLKSNFKNRNQSFIEEIDRLINALQPISEIKYQEVRNELINTKQLISEY